MSLLDLIFLLVHKFVPIPDSNLAMLEKDGRAWELDLETKENALAKLYKRFNGEWYFRLLWAVLYLPLQRFFSSPEVDVELD